MTHGAAFAFLCYTLISQILICLCAVYCVYFSKKKEHLSPKRKTQFKTEVCDHGLGIKLTSFFIFCTQWPLCTIADQMLDERLNSVFNPHGGISGAQSPGQPLITSHPHLPLHH